MPVRRHPDRVIATTAALIFTAAGSASAAQYPSDAKPTLQILNEVYDTNVGTPDYQAIVVKNQTFLTNAGGTSLGSTTATADLAGGLVKAGAFGSGSRSASANSTAYDFVNFNFAGASKAIDYRVSVDGELWKTDASGYAAVTAEVAIFDVTGMETVFTPFPDNSGRKFIAATPVSTDFVNFTYDSSDDSGTSVPYETLLEGSFIAAADHVYGVRIQLSAFYNVAAGSDAGSDFSHTATFQFTSLDGATFNSSSGVFLTVPEPSLFSVGSSAALVILARRR